MTLMILLNLFSYFTQRVLHILTLRKCSSHFHYKDQPHFSYPMCFWNACLRYAAATTHNSSHHTFADYIQTNPLSFPKYNFGNFFSEYTMRFRLSHINLIAGILTFIVVIYAEWIYPAKALNECTWPLGPTAKHIALIADPQLVDDNTYPGRNKLFMWFTRVFADRYMARNFRLLHQKMRPDVVYFLGDLFDGGRRWEDKAWKEEYERFMRVFPTSLTVPHYKNLPGNHDVGSADEIISSAFDRFRTTFGQPNQVTTIGEHSIVTLDTNSLMNKFSEGKQAREFFNALKDNQEDYSPMIVLTHIPLFRPDGSYCGFEREGKPLTWEKGQQYITEISPDITQDILFGLKPVYVFSGDDHDACKYTHRWSLAAKTEEHTVKSFSLAMGITRPGFQLLSVDTRNRHETESCLVAKPFYPLIFQLVACGLILAAHAAFCIGLTPKKYKELPVSNNKDQSKKGGHGISKEFTQCVIFMSCFWIMGQFLINWWSYSKAI